MSKNDVRGESFDPFKLSTKQFRKWFFILCTLGFISSVIINNLFIPSMDILFSKNQFLIILPLMMIILLLMKCSNSEKYSFFSKTFLLGFSLGSLIMGLTSYADIFSEKESYNIIEHTLKINKSLLLAGISAVCYRLLSYSQNYMRE